MSFYLFGEPDDALKIKAFSSSTRGGKATIRIELETSNMTEFGWALRSLAETQQSQRAKSKPEPKPKAAKPRVLALPAPQLALPAPLLALPAPKERN